MLQVADGEIEDCWFSNYTSDRIKPSASMIRSLRPGRCAANNALFKIESCANVACAEGRVSTTGLGAFPWPAYVRDRQEPFRGRISVRSLRTRGCRRLCLGRGRFCSHLCSGALTLMVHDRGPRGHM